MTGRARLALAVVAGLASSSQAGASDELVQKLVGEPLVVLLDQGVGSATLVCGLKVRANAQAGPPSVTVTDAVGIRDTIPASALRFAWDAVDPALPTLLRGRLAVEKPVTLEPAVAYKGTLVLATPEGVTQPIDFTLIDRKTLGFEAESEKADLAYVPGQPLEFRLRVRNTGQVPIRSIEMTTLGLVDGAHRVAFAAAPAVAIGPSREQTVVVHIPAPRSAGTYTGSVRVTANGGAEGHSLPLTIRARGPNRIPLLSAELPWLPITLFVLVMLVAFWASNQLDGWFGEGGGLVRAEATLALRRAGTELETVHALIGGWPGPLSQANAWIGIERDELQRTVRDAESMSLGLLGTQAQRFETSAAMAGALGWAVEMATARWNDAELEAVLARLDRVPRASDGDAYRKDLRKTIETVGVDKGASVVPPRAASPTDDQLRARMRAMRFLYQTIVWLVVVFTAYQSFYGKNPAFGSFTDYVAVFLWTLGLTQTGSKIVARVR